MPNTYTFDANQHPTTSESTASLERIMDPAKFGTMSLPGANTEEPKYDSNAWFNERQVETAESLFHSMINHTSPAPEISYAQEPQTTDTVTPSIESAARAEQANPERNLALEAMATAADALLDPVLLEEPAGETTIAPSPNFEAVQGKVVPWGSVSSGDDRDHVTNGWASMDPEDRSSDAHNHADFHDGPQQEFVNHGVSHEAFDEPSVEFDQTRSNPFQATEAMDTDLRMQEIGLLLQQETSKQDGQISSFDPSLEEAYGEVSERHLHMSNIDPSLEGSYGELESAQMSNIDPSLEGAYDQSPDQIQHSNIDPSLDEAYGYATQQDAQMLNIDPSLEEAYSEISKHRIAQAETETQPWAVDEAVPEAKSLEVQALTEFGTRMPTSPVLANGIISPITPRAISPKSKIPAVEVMETKRSTNGETNNYVSPNSVENISNTQPRTSSKPKTETMVEDDATMPEADEDTIKRIGQIRQEDLGLRRRRAS